jgi:Na+/melibiose symporter-like transporter
VCCHPTFFTQTGIFTIVVVASAMVSCPIIIKGAKRFGKRRCLEWICLLMCAVLVAATFFIQEDVDLISIPAGGDGGGGTAFRVSLENVVAMFLGVGFVGSFALPDALLADLIDYDELHSGKRKEGAYTVAETNLQQFVEIPVYYGGGRGSVATAL